MNAACLNSRSGQQLPPPPFPIQNVSNILELSHLLWLFQIVACDFVELRQRRWILGVDGKGIRSANQGIKPIVLHPLAIPAALSNNILQNMMNALAITSTINNLPNNGVPTKFGRKFLLRESSCSYRHCAVSKKVSVERNAFNYALHYRELTNKLNGNIREQGSRLMDSNRGGVARNNAAITVQNILDFHGLEDSGGCGRLSQSLSL